MNNHNGPVRERVVDLRKNNPEMTLIAIGNSVGVSRERVRQILIESNLPTRSTGSIPLPMPSCKRCGNPVPYKKRVYCDISCQFPTGRTTYNCHGCGTEITVMTSVYEARLKRAKYLHCSRKCRDGSRKGTPMIHYQNSN